MKKERLFVFDIDDTLVYTDTKIHFRDPVTNKILQSMSTGEFRDWRRTGTSTTCTIDTDDFKTTERTLDGFLRGKPGPGIKMLKQLNLSKWDFGIVTSRSDEQAIVEALPELFEKHGIQLSIPNNRVVATYDSRYAKRFKRMDGSQRKLSTLLAFCKEYEFVAFVDDDSLHIDAINRYCKKHPHVGLAAVLV